MFRVKSSELSVKSSELRVSPKSSPKAIQQLATCHLPLATCHLPFATCHLQLAIFNYDPGSYLPFCYLLEKCRNFGKATSLFVEFCRILSIFSPFFSSKKKVQSSGTPVLGMLRYPLRWRFPQAVDYLIAERVGLF